MFFAVTECGWLCFLQSHSAVANIQQKPLYCTGATLPTQYLRSHVLFWSKQRLPWLPPSWLTQSCGSTCRLRGSCSAGRNKSWQSAYLLLTPAMWLLVHTTSDAAGWGDATVRMLADASQSLVHACQAIEDLLQHIQQQAAIAFLISD